MMTRKRSKYNVDRSAVGKLRRTLDGVCYDSAAERDYAAVLAHAKRIGVIKNYERQVRFTFIVNGVTICSHIVDFVIVNPEGSQECREVKGVETAVWKMKRKLFEALYPDIKYVVVKPTRAKK